MKRPKTYRFSELWTENQEDQLTKETRTSRPLRRRRGRPLGKRFRRRATAMLNRIRTAVARGADLSAVATALGVPVEVLQEWALEELE